MRYSPQSIVAIILALCLLLTIVGSVFFNNRALDLERANIWADLLKVLLGGLIGYIMSENRNER